MYKKKGLIISLVFFNLVFNFYIFSKRDIQIQEIHKKVSDDLLNLKKEYPKGQSTIYSILDQVGKMYQISKTVIIKKREYKKQFKAKIVEVDLLKAEVTSLKKDIINNKLELENKNKNIALMSKDIEKKDRLLTFISKEKERILKQHQNLNQSLKLTSTSEPISPL